MEELLLELQALQIEISGTMGGFNLDLSKFIIKKNNAAARRARKKSILIEDYLKKVRSLTLEMEKLGYK